MVGLGLGKDKLMSNYYTLTGDRDHQAAQWTYRTTLDPVISAPRSRVIAVAMYRHAIEHGYVDTFRQEWLAKRNDWLARSFMVQRKWQRDTRNPDKAKHHDSIALRDKYVRVVGSWS